MPFFVTQTLHLLSCNPYFFLRCVTNDQCKQNNFDKRTLSFVITPAMLAEDATCPGEEPQTCCHEANIEQQCTDYEADGYR